MGKISEQKQHSKLSGCLRCGDTSHYWRDYDVDPGDDWVKQRADELWKVKEANDRRGEVNNRKRCKHNAISGDTLADNLMSLIDYSKLAKVSAPVLNYILVDSGSLRLAV